MRRAWTAAIALSLTAVALLGLGSDAAARKPDRPAMGSLRMVGHSALFHRGANSSVALAGDHAYVGNFADGTRPQPGVLIVSVKRPERPRVVGRIGPPAGLGIGDTSIELRVWPRRQLLMVATKRCTPPLCAGVEGTQPALRFYDISGPRASRPALVAAYALPSPLHEFFLWEDPNRPGRALVYGSTPGNPQLSFFVLDISLARSGIVSELGRFTLPRNEVPFLYGVDSLSVSRDGRLGFLATLDLGFVIVDTSDFAEARPAPQARLITPLGQRAVWPGANVHSAVPVPGRALVLTTDETYGCPWGWTRVIDVADPATPQVIAEARVLPYNHPAFCSPRTRAGRRRLADTAMSSLSTHTLTTTRDLAVISWYGSGLRVFGIENPRRPRHLARFVPKPLRGVATEDPALSGGPRVVVSSYPVIRKGLIYVVDVRNGLYLLRYEGPGRRQLERTHLAEGDSSLIG